MQPSLDLFFDDLCSAFGYDLGALTMPLGIESGVVSGTNPPYTVADFLAIYPKFGGVPAQATGTLASGSPTVTAVPSMAGLSAGQAINGIGIPAGTTITALNPAGNTLTISQNATASGVVQLSIYTSPFVPFAVMNLYIALASASIMQARWLGAWQLAMGLYVAHFLTLWLQSDGDVYSTPGQAAAAGLQRGVQVSKGVGDVSVGYQAIQGFESWGAWNLTSYGLQLATMARVVGAGPVYVR